MKVDHRDDDKWTVTAEVSDKSGLRDPDAGPAVFDTKEQAFAFQEVAVKRIGEAQEALVDLEDLEMTYDV